MTTAEDVERATMTTTIATKVARQVREVATDEYSSGEAYTLLEMMRLLKSMQDDAYRASDDAKARAAALLKKAGMP